MNCKNSRKNDFSISRSLKCDRLKVHKNFMLALMIRYVVSIVYYEPYIYGKQQPHVWFRDGGTVSSLYKYHNFTSKRNAELVQKMLS